MREVYPVSKLIEKVIESIDYYGYIDELYKGDKEEAEERKDNVKEFISVAMEFEQNSEEKDLETFLTGVALTSESSEEEEIDKVSLMTIHTSKGLEFPVVFIVGMEDGLFPIARAVRSMSDSEIEEERRLCYVGITRAKEILYLTLTQKRTLYGKTNPSIASRFMEELPKECIERLNSAEKELSYSKANYNVLDKYKQKYMNTINKTAVAKQVNATIKSNEKETNIDDIKPGARGGFIKEMKDDAIRLLNENNITFDKYYWHIDDKLEICQKENVDIMIDDDWKIIKKLTENKIKTLYFRDTNLMKLEENEYIKEVNNWGDIYRYIRSKD